MTARNDAAKRANLLNAELIGLKARIDELMAEVRNLQVNATDDHVTRLEIAAQDLLDARKSRSKARMTWCQARDILVDRTNTNLDGANELLNEVVRLINAIRSTIGLPPLPAEMIVDVPASKSETPEVKVDEDKGDKPVASKPSTSDPAPVKGKDEESKGDDKPVSDVDKLLAAIKGVGDKCDKQHEDLKADLAEVRKGLLKPELAAEINKLTVDQLVAMRDRRGLTPQEAAIVETFAGYTPDEIRTMLANLKVLSDGLERMRHPLGGDDKPTERKTPRS